MLRSETPGRLSSRGTGAGTPPEDTSSTGAGEEGVSAEEGPEAVAGRRRLAREACDAGEATARAAECPLGFAIGSRVLNQGDSEGLVLTGAGGGGDWQVSKSGREAAGLFVDACP